MIGGIGASIVHAKEAVVQFVEKDVVGTTKDAKKVVPALRSPVKKQAALRKLKKSHPASKVATKGVRKATKKSPAKKTTKKAAPKKRASKKSVKKKK